MAEQLASWVLEALRILAPASRQTVSQWADGNRVLEFGESSRPGPWRTDFVPYLRAIMDAFNDPEVEEIVFVKPTQVGGTEALLNIIGYIICNDPAPMMAVYPQKELGESISENRIQRMLRQCPALAARWLPDGKRMELHFADGAQLNIVGANSPSDLASRAIKYLFLDEEDKFPARAGKESSPTALAKERQRSYTGSHKLLRTSTPTVEDGPIWRAWLAADTQMECFVTCPYCGSQWTFAFRQLNIPDRKNPTRAKQESLYACKECGAIITDADRLRMLQGCEWKPVRTNESRRRLGFRLNAFYSPWLSFGDIAAAWCESYQQPEELQNFINSVLAEPFLDVEGQLDAEFLLNKRQSVFPRSEVPPDTVLLTGGVDVQRACFYWTIRAWLPNMASFNIAHGQALSWAEIEWLMNEIYAARNGAQYQVQLCCIDSGDQTDDVYDFCSINQEWAVPVKGSSARMNERFRVRRIERSGLSQGMPLVIVDTGHYKDLIYSRVYRDIEQGGWYLHADCDPEYAEQICSEQKIIERKGGRLQRVWKPRATGRPNHYFDCEVYAACAADLMGLRDLHSELVRRQNQPELVAIGNAYAQPAGQEQPSRAFVRHSFRRR